MAILPMTHLFALYRYRDLVRYLVGRELKVRYRRSTIGFLWTMLQPMLTMAVMTVAFSTIFRFDIGNYPVYALAGILFWNFFNQSVVTSMNSLRNNATLIGKVPIPSAVFPIATVLAGVVNFLLALVPLLVVVTVTGHPLTWSLLFLPVSILLAAIFTLGAGLVLSPLAVFFHDVVEMVGVILTTMMYLTPIFYPMSIIPDRFRWMVRFNPLRSVLEVFRDPIYYGKVPPLPHIAVAVAVAFGTAIVGALFFRRSSHRIPFYV